MNGPGAPGGTAIRPLNDIEFVQLRDVIYRNAGIFLSTAKKALLAGRLARRLRELGLGSFGDYYRHVRSGTDPQELSRLLEAICTHETHFFREPRQFEFLEQRLVPQWEMEAAAGRRPRRVRVWSAGCSTGEEPYSLAMSLLALLGQDRGWHVDILATDLSSRALARAEAAVWPIAKAAEIPPVYQRAFMLRGTRSQEGLMKAGPRIRSAVRFEPYNLSQAGTRYDGPFDAILCRNVLIYFDAPSRSKVVHHLIANLAPSGVLFLGHSESLNGVTNRLSSVGPTVYGWPPAPPAAARGAASRYPPRMP